MNIIKKDRRTKYIYWFAHYNLDSPSVRYRAKYPLDFAGKELQINSKLIVPGYSPKNILQFITTYLSALLFPKKESIIVIQRLSSNFIYSNLLKLLVLSRKKRTIYDLDDADYLETNPKTLHYFAKKCHYISSGSKALSHYLKDYNSQIFRLSSPTPDLGITKGKKNEILTIGWIGGFGWGHKDSLFEFVFPALLNLSFKIKLVLIGIYKTEDERNIRAYFKNSPNLEIEIPKISNWNDEEDLQGRICRFDLGIATLLNHPIQIAKSGIKAKQYMNNGIPVLSTNLPENNQFVIDGFNGFLCDTIEDFKSRIIHFNEMSKEQYEEFSINSRASIMHFNHRKYFQDLENGIASFQ